MNLKDIFKKANIKTPIGEISDGHHTFNELYHHRTILFACILNQNPEISWKSKLHHDLTMFDGYFIAGIKTPKGDFTYHQELKYWEDFRVPELDRGVEFDGHSSEDVVRLLDLGDN